jgi:hypothetical protein
MANLSSLSSRHDLIIEQFSEKYNFVKLIQLNLKKELILNSTLTKTQIEFYNFYLNDLISIFRFCRRARFIKLKCYELINSTLIYRLNSFILSSIPLILPININNEDPLFFFHPNLNDKLGRPAAILNLKLVKRNHQGQLDELKDNIRLGWEMGRRYLNDLSFNQSKLKLKIQMVVMVDLQGANMSNLVRQSPHFALLLLNSPVQHIQH